jgi:transketolase
MTQQHQYPRAMRDVLLESLASLMRFDKSVVLISADFGSPVIDRIKEESPHQFLNVGIAEQTLINVASGMALEGFNVFAYAIAPFITMRCYEQIRVNLALTAQLRPMNVSLIGVGAGYSYYVSGPTHQCFEDISIMRTLPNLRILSPSDHAVAANIPVTCIGNNALRYIRLDAQLLPVLTSVDSIEDTKSYGRYRVIMSGGDGLLISTGFGVHLALTVAEQLREKNGLFLSVLDLTDFSAVDDAYFLSVIKSFNFIFTLEEGFIGVGGLDALITECIARHTIKAIFKSFGVNRRYTFSFGSRRDLLSSVGLSEKNIMGSISTLMSTN